VRKQEKMCGGGGKYVEKPGKYAGKAVNMLKSREICRKGRKYVKKNEEICKKKK
jgi:hypothetical protein